jgi:hypothetical protein
MARPMSRQSRLRVILVLGARGQVLDGSKVQAANTHRVDLELG